VHLEVRAAAASRSGTREGRRRGGVTAIVAHGIP
jgi:hypothetical protein